MGIQRSPKTKTNGKQKVIEIWCGSRAGTKGDYRQAVSDRNIKKLKSETKGKDGEMAIL